MVAPSGCSYVWKLRDTGNEIFDRCWGWKRAESRGIALRDAHRDAERIARCGAGAQLLVEDLDESDPRVPPEPKKGGLEATSGVLEEEGISFTFGGACPVQGDGVVDGLSAYYRARGSGWELEVMLKTHDDAESERWVYQERAYAWPDGGWIHHDVSIENIRRAVAAFRRRKETGGSKA